MVMDQQIKLYQDYAALKAYPSQDQQIYFNMQPKIGNL